MKTMSFTRAMMFATMLAASAVPAFAQSTNSQTFEGWANETATTNNGRISRELYLNEMGRRWDADANHVGTREAYLRELGTRWDKMDRDKHGLTPAQISEMTGKVDSGTSRLPQSGSGVQPGNMGPANSKGQ
jgi:hypothetical protein